MVEVDEFPVGLIQHIAVDELVAGLVVCRFQRGDHSGQIAALAGLCLPGKRPDAPAIAGLDDKRDAERVVACADIYAEGNLHDTLHRGIAIGESRYREISRCQSGNGKRPGFGQLPGHHAATALGRAVTATKDIYGALLG
ncbi:hypothetical protein [Mesorhizobium sp. CAU 1741]|uniref:hypothetical protein n=1 Tax=Mesorhizobium sp. CAU 1741 TaxID=3140366 RepID=UPI00325B85BF